jgi:polyketide cyclase/dehydrase/lipid transport protein
MRWVIRILGIFLAIIVLVVAVVAGVGAMLPKEHVATRAAHFREQPDEIWKAISTPAEFPKWRPEVKSVEMIPDSGGHVVWVEHSGQGWSAQETPYQMTEFVPPVGAMPGRMVARIASPNLPFGGSWNYELSAVDGGTLLRITEHGEVRSVVFRFVSRYIVGQTKTMEDYLTALGGKFGEKISIQE